MTDHLSLVTINALADGELSADQLAIANDHLAACPACTSTALVQTLLKTNVAKAAQRYAMPPDMEQRLQLLASRDGSQTNPGTAQASRPAMRSSFAGWAVAALLLLVFSGTIGLLHRGRQAEVASVEHSAQITEVCDLHIATLAAGQDPQVISSDRHTVKPWFQGKLPFSFNLPETLPSDTKLDGANLTYLHNQPVAQLLYHIGRHRVSVFLTQRRSTDPGSESQSEHSGFRVVNTGVGDLNLVAVSDVDPARLLELVGIIKGVQTGAQTGVR
jgi:anti-sigma factor RsiW